MTNPEEVHPEPPVDKKRKCTTCNGFGLHMLGDHTPMGPMDAQDGMPTIACPECGADANPVDGDAEYRARSRPPVGGGEEADLILDTCIAPKGEYVKLARYQALLSRAEGLAEAVDKYLNYGSGVVALKTSLADFKKGKE